MKSFFEQYILSVRSALAIVISFALACCWYVVAADYDYGALAGTYHVAFDGVSWTLRLRSDRTFTEQISGAGRTKTVSGTWHRFGEGHVAFSSEFVPLPNEEIARSGEAYGVFEKALGLWPSLTLESIPNGITLRRRAFR